MIVCLNIGTSSIKTSSYNTDGGLTLLGRHTFDLSPDHIEQIIIDTVQKSAFQLSDLSALGVRIVHGGNQYYAPTRITDDVFRYLESIQDLAPLHNPPTLQAIKTLRTLYPSVPVIGVFDTGFHQTMPDKAKLYAVPLEWRDIYFVQRYGFHGLAHQSMRDAFIKETNTPLEKTTIITLQLGSGCSMCAIKDGHSVDTTMGFSPLEGIISRTRSGDIDPTVLSYLSHKMNRSVDDILYDLNHKTGLSGVSQTDGDIRMVDEKIVEEDASALLAMELFIYRIQKYLGAYDAVLGGAQAFIFGGGISEHNQDILHRIFSNPYYGVSLENEIKITGDKYFFCVSHEHSKRPVYIARVDEEEQIATGVVNTLTNHSS